MICALVAFTPGGAALGKRLADALGGTLHVPARLAQSTGMPSYDSLEAWTASHWETGRALVFIGAAGIAVRAIAPHVQDKFRDPAVVSVDETGQYAVALLSGHVGGANSLAARIAGLTGETAVISTATDLHGRFAVDVWASRQGLLLKDRQVAKEVSAALLAGASVRFSSEFPVEGALPFGLTEQAGVLPEIQVTCHNRPQPRVLRLVPRCLVLGIGCRRGTTEEAIAQAVQAAAEEAEIDTGAVLEVATIDQKADEEGLCRYCQRQNWPLRTYSAQVLGSLPGTFTASSFVYSVMGVDNVCERAALAGGGTLLVPKRAQNGVTVAIARRNPVLKFEESEE